MNNNIQLKKLRDLIVDFVTEAVQLENLSLTYKNTYEIIYHYKQSKNKYTRNQTDAVIGALNGYEYIKNILAKQPNYQFGVEDLKKINKLVDKYEEEDFTTDELAGNWKKIQGYITNCQYIPPLLKGEEYAKIADGGISKINNFDGAIEYFVRLCKAQPFPDGNKRSSLIFTNALCISKKIPLIRIPNSLEFQEELGKFYENENYLPNLTKYIKNESLSRQTSNNELVAEQLHTKPANSIDKILDKFKQASANKAPEINKERKNKEEDNGRSR